MGCKVWGKLGAWGNVREAKALTAIVQRADAVVLDVLAVADGERVVARLALALTQQEGPMGAPTKDG